MLPPAFRPTPSKLAGTQLRSRRREGLSPCLALQQTDRSRLPFHTGPVKRVVLPSCLNSFFELLESILRARRENLDNSEFSSDSAGPGCANPGTASRSGTAWGILFEELQRWKREVHPPFFGEGRSKAIQSPTRNCRKNQKRGERNDATAHAQKHQLNIECPIFNIQYSIFGVRCSIFDIEYWIFDSLSGDPPRAQGC